MTAMSTLFYPDVSSAQAGMSLAGAPVVCAKITQGRGYFNPAYAEFRRQAEAQGSLFFAYHFLEEGHVAEQAAWCRQHAGLVPVMVDCEPDTQIGSFPTLADLLGFTDAYRMLGGVMHLAYLPHWHWSDPPRIGGMGSPSLAPLAGRNVTLVSSAYTAYSDDGPGWEPYGGMKPGIWQYTDDAHVNGRLVDRNAFKGPVAQLRALITTGSTAIPAEHAASEEDDDMNMLVDGTGAETIISIQRASKTWIAFACDASRTRAPAPKLRVAVHSASRGMTQVENVTMPASGKHTVGFTAKDADFISVVRETGNTGDQVAVGFNLG